MRRSQWEFALSLDRSDRAPLYLQITRAFVDEITRGRLKPGDVLPGTRTLAARLRVNRVTVLTAYEELAAEGWITTHPARGCMVAAQVVPSTQRRTGTAPATTAVAPPYTLAPAPIVQRSPEHLSGVLVFGASSPDPRLLDVEPLARAYRRALRKGGGRLLGYSDPQGHPRLRAAIAGMLCATRGMSVSAEQVFVTRGSQMALALTARAILRPGDVVAVEALGYRQIWQTFQAVGAEPVPVPVDRRGLDTRRLADLLRSHRISAVYVTPQRQFPTTVTMSLARRCHLLELASAHRFAILEDDYDHEFHYEGARQLPLASRDSAGTVVYIGSFSKLLAPGVRLGFVSGPKQLLDRLAAHRECLDLQGDCATEAAVAEMLEDGEVQRHVRRVGRIYRLRRDTLAELLRDTFGDRLAFAVPSGGVALWLRASAIDVESWARTALERGVAFQTARAFRFDSRPQPYARLGYACLDADELREAVRRLRCAMDALRPRDSSALRAATRAS
jgi:GntR family transcriptional regulator / MocR family aminotransferase